MQAEVDPIGQAWMAFVEYRQRLGPAAWEAFLFPDLVKPAGVASIPCQEVLAADPQPARDPDVDGIGLGQRALDDLLDGKQRNGCHGNTRLTDMRHGTIDRTGR